MKVGDLIRLSSMAVRVYGLRSNCGLIVDRVPATGHTDDYRVLVDGAVHHFGSAIKISAVVINAH